MVHFYCKLLYCIMITKWCKIGIFFKTKGILREKIRVFRVLTLDRM